MDEFRSQHGASCADRVTMSDSPTFDIDEILGKPKLARDHDGNGRKGFIDLDTLDRANVPAGALQCLLDRRHRTETEHAGLDRRDSIRNKASSHREAALIGPGLVG